jgi:hypothetical protein
VVSANRLMLYKETTAVYCENRTEHRYTVYEQNAEFVKASGTYSNQFDGSVSLILSGHGFNSPFRLVPSEMICCVRSEFDGNVLKYKTLIIVGIEDPR